MSDLRLPTLNRILIAGRCTRDPEVRYIQSGTAVTTLGVASSRAYKDPKDPSGDWKEETCFVDIVVWARRAEICHSNLHKGSPVFLEGRLHLDTWESQAGEKRSRLKVVANNVIFLNPPQKAPRGGGRRSDRQKKVEAPPPENVGEAKEESSEADFPF